MFSNIKIGKINKKKGKGLNMYNNILLISISKTNTPVSQTVLLGVFYFLLIFINVSILKEGKL